MYEKRLRKKLYSTLPNQRLFPATTSHKLAFILQPLSSLISIDKYGDIKKTSQGTSVGLSQAISHELLIVYLLPCHACLIHQTLEILFSIRSEF